MSSINDLKNLIQNIPAKEIKELGKDENFTKGISSLRGLSDFLDTFSRKLNLTAASRNLQSLSKAFNDKTVGSIENVFNLFKDFKTGAEQKKNLVFLKEFFESIRSIQELNVSVLIRNLVILKALPLQSLLNHFNKIGTGFKKISEGKQSFIAHLGNLFSSLSRIKEIGIGSLVKNLMLMRLIPFNFLLKGFANLKEIEISDTFMDSVERLDSIVQTFRDLAEIKWGKVILGLGMMKVLGSVMGRERPTPSQKVGSASEGNYGRQKTLLQLPPPGKGDILEVEISRISEKAFSNPRKGFGGVFSRLGSILKNSGSKSWEFLKNIGSTLMDGLKELGPLLMRGLAAAGPGLAIAATAAAAYAFGTYLDKTFGLSDKFSKFLAGSDVENAAKLNKNLEASKLEGGSTAAKFMNGLDKNGSKENQISVIEAKRKEVTARARDLMSSGAGSTDSGRDEIDRLNAEARQYNKRLAELRGGSDIGTPSSNTGSLMMAMTSENRALNTATPSPVVISGGSSSGVQTNNVTTVVQSKAFDRTDMVAYGFRGGRHR